MGTSLSHRLVVFVLKAKGVKRIFSQTPIDFKKLRKEDVQYPKSGYFKRNGISQVQVLNSKLIKIPGKKASAHLVLFIHGGAFISGPAQHHWDTIKTIHKQTGITIWMCNYPKAPENQITEISRNIDAIYEHALEKYNGGDITIIGDSVGGTLTTALVQRIIQKNLPKPKQIILVSPVMDATLSNPEIEKVDKVDPMLSKAGALSAKKMCTEPTNLDDPQISPINGSFNQFPKTILFLAEHDIMYPDELRLVNKLKAANVDTDTIIGASMPHIWPLLPVMKEARIALQQIISYLE